MQEYIRLYGGQDFLERVFIVVSGMWGLFYTGCLQWCLKKATQLVYLSDLEANIYRKSGYPKGVVIGNRCVIKDSPKGPNDHDEETVLYAGKLSYGKGVDLLLAAWKVVHAEHPTWKLVLCGEGPLELWVRQFSEEHALSESIEIKGRISHEALMGQYRRAACTVVPSVWPEPFGRVIIESLLTGTPTLVTEQTGTAAFVEEHKLGWVVEASTESLVRGIQNALDGARIVRQHIRARKGLLATLWDKNIIDAHWRLYRSLT